MQILRGFTKISVTAERRFVEKLWTVVGRREQITINSSVGWEAGSLFFIFGGVL